MNTEVKNSVGSNILSKENISLTSEEDMKLKQANIQGKNITINSKKDILIESGVSTLDSKRSSQSLNGEINLLTGQFNVGSGVTKDKSTEKTHTNSQIYGENIAIKSKDLSVKGGNIEADKVNIEAKNLHIESMQDKANSKHQALNISVGPSSAGGGIEYGKYEKEWLNKQSTLIGRNGGKVDTDSLTNIGAVIGSESEKEKLKISANKVVAKDLEDKNKYENIGGGINFGTDVPNILVKHDNVDKEQINRATAINTELTINNEEKTAEDLGFNTDLEKAQEIAKDKEKHLDAELHTDLLDKEERDKIVLAGRKIGTVIEALTEDKGVDKLETYKVGLRAIHIDELRKEREKEFAFVDDENTSPLDKLRALRDLQAELYKKEGYTGVLPELYITDEPNSFAVDGKNGETRKIFISLNDLKRGNSSALLYAHENAHLIQSDKDEEIAKYAETKIGENKNKFTENEKEEYLSNLRKNVEIDKTLEEQFAEAKLVDEKDKEHFTPFSYSISGSLAVAVDNSGIGHTYTQYVMKDIKNNRVEVVTVKEADIGVAGPYDVGGSLSFGIYNLKSYDEFGNNVTATGASVDPLWAYNRVFTGSDEGLGITTGGERVTNENGKFLGGRIYIGKSFKNYEFHSKTSIDDMTEIISKEIYTIPEYLEKYHSRGGRNSWK